MPKISILTTITNPEERQDKWQEALNCYLDIADEVVVVDGSKEPINLKFNKLKQINLPWPNEWNWAELPRHLNAGLEQCTGDWVIKLDIDQFFHEREVDLVKNTLAIAPENIDVVTFQKISMVCDKRYYQKGPTPIAFRRKKYIKIGRDKNRRTDLCFPIRVEGEEEVKINKEYSYMLPVGTGLKRMKGREKFWNYDYFFKTEEFTRKEFFRFSKAYKRYFGTWGFGSTEEESFKRFIIMMKGRYDRAPYRYTLSDHPKWIRKAVSELTPDQFGFNGWKKI